MKGFLASAPALQATAHAATACSHQLEIRAAPSTPRGTPSNTASYAVQSFGGGAYIVTDGSYQNVFFVSTAGVIHVDLPPTIGNVTSQPITHIVYSHPQADHIGAASLVAGPGKPVEAIAREDPKELLQEAPDASRPLPAVTFKDDYRLRVRQPDARAALRRRETRPRQHLHLRAGAEAARPHRRRLLWLGPLRVPGRQQQHLRLDRGARQGAGVRLRIPCQRVLGHARRRAGAEGVHAGPASCKQGLDLTTTLPSAAVLQGAVELMNPGNPWAVFRGYPAVVVEHCGNATNKKWVGRLGAADVLGIRHAWMMVES